MEIDPQAVKHVSRILLKQYGRQNLGNKDDPFDELLFILLSSKTPPERYESAYEKLKNSYPNPTDLADVHWQIIADIISYAGLQNRKAKAIVAISKQLRDQFGTVSLSFLSKLSTTEAEKFLISFPEVSIKSARCILMYSIDRQLFPVDSHCFRIIKRLGWVSTDQNLTDKCADELQENIPPEFRKDLHVGMILLGRQYCTPKNPSCKDCPIVEFCITGQEALKSRETLP